MPKDIVELKGTSRETCKVSDINAVNTSSDLRDAYVILGQVAGLLSYLSNSKVRPAISERERVAMRTMEKIVVDFRTEVKDFYSATELEGLFQ